MKKEYLLTALFFTTCASIVFLFYKIIIPFFVPITWAAIFVIILYPLYEKLLKTTKRAWLASLLACFFSIVLIIGPLTYLFVAVVSEAADAVKRINELYSSGQLNNLLDFDIPWLASMKEKLSQYYDISKINLDEIARDAVNRVSGIIVSQTTKAVTNGTKTIFYFGLMNFTMYYFFTEGEELVNRIKKLMPLSVAQVNQAFSQLRDVILATMYGGVVVALLQGILGGLLFWIVGIPSPIFWGAIMAFLAIIPMVGAFIIYIPAGIILMIQGYVGKGLLVMLVGGLIISQIDNVIRPYLISGRTCLHPLMLFFTILGGIAMFGLLGIVIGPMIAAAFMILFQIFEMRLRPEDEELPATGISE